MPEKKVSTLKDEILSNIDNPLQLEHLYLNNKTSFKREFNKAYDEIKENRTAQIWNIRLNFKKEQVLWGTGKEQIFVLVAAIVAGLMAQIPEIAGIEPEYFFLRNMGFVVFPILSGYFAWYHRMPFKNLLGVALAFIISAVYINLLPNDTQSDTLVLASIHLLLFLWSVLGYTFAGGSLQGFQRRLEFLQYNGNLLVMTALLIMAGGLLTGITMGLFLLIDLNIENFYFQYVVISGLAAVPIAGTYLIQANPSLVNNVSPVIARIFTPIVLITLVVYLAAVVITGKNPYHDRDFLLIFNALIICVLAIIFFSVTDTSKSNTGIAVLTFLSAVTILLNVIALSAIVFRISEWGITPNRLAVLGTNILVLTNLTMVAWRLTGTLRGRYGQERIEECIAFFLPFYFLWSMVVVFAFPALFGFK